MSEEIKIYFDEDGIGREYDDTYDITIHCESEEEQNEVLDRLNRRWHWIPVSERLPEEDGQYLACTDDGYVATLWYDITMKLGWLLNANVIAWMPLPEMPERSDKE